MAHKNLPTFQTAYANYPRSNTPTETPTQTPTNTFQTAYANYPRSNPTTIQHEDPLLK